MFMPKVEKHKIWLLKVGIKICKTINKVKYLYVYKHVTRP